jgi:hypothetical protein
MRETTESIVFHVDQPSTWLDVRGSLTPNDVKDTKASFFVKETSL